MTESDGKIWISHGFLWENEMEMVGKPLGAVIRPI